MRLRQKIALLLTGVMLAGAIGVMNPAEVKAEGAYTDTIESTATLGDGPIIVEKANQGVSPKVLSSDDLGSPSEPFSFDYTRERRWYVAYNDFIPSTSGSSGQNAKDFVRALNDANYDGYNDWTLLEGYDVEGEWFNKFNPVSCGNVTWLWSDAEDGNYTFAFEVGPEQGPRRGKILAWKQQCGPDFGFLLLRELRDRREFIPRNHDTGSIPDDPYTPTANNATISNDTGSVATVSADISDGSAVVSNIPKDTVEQIADPNINGNDIILDVSGTGNGNDVTKVTLTKETVENIADAFDSEENNRDNLVIKTDNATVTLDLPDLEAVASQAKADDIRLVVENKSEAELNDNQKKEVENLGKGDGSKEKSVVQIFEASITSGESTISNFNGEEITIGKVDYEIPAEKNPENYHVYYIPEDGKAERFTTWVEDDCIHFATNHLSDWAIVYDESMVNGRKEESKPDEVVNSIPVYRLFNPKNRDHLFTTDQAEIDACKSAGWKYEGVAFNSMTGGSVVYRLHNKKTGEHLYTQSIAERDACVARGWKLEGVSFTAAGNKSVYRLFNGTIHHYTADKAERDALVSRGWTFEGVAFMAD